MQIALHFQKTVLNFLEYGDAHIGMQAGEEISLRCDVWNASGVC